MTQKHANRSPGRDGYPLSLAPLTAVDALNRAMQVPAPERDPKPAKAAKRPAKKSPRSKKRAT